MITYKTMNTHPGTLPSATIHLGGLNCLSFDQANKCTVGVNRVGNGHKWKFSIADLTQKSVEPEVVRTEESAFGLREIQIEVTGSTTHGTYVYNGGPVSIAHGKEKRFNLESSWIDLEGPRGHNKPVENDVNTLWPRFNINEGLFCASKLSIGTYNLRDSNSKPLIKPLGQIALEIVVDIFLDASNPNSKIDVKLPNRTISLDPKKRYEIYITNDCDSVGPAQTDFYLHYKAFSNAFNGAPGKMKTEDQFHLVHNTATKGKTESISAKAGDDYSELNDRAPCMTIVLGQTKAFK